jgi:putative DNA primase/helicase
VTIPDKEQDRHLQKKFLEESVGILAWAVQGCLAWQRDGFGVPPEVETATEKYRDDMDVLADFIEDRCVVDAGAKVLVGDLYGTYMEWCVALHEDALSVKAFASEMEERGYAKFKGTGGNRYRRGIGLKTAE